SAEHDQLEKLAAIDAAAEVAAALTEDEARRLWRLMLPISQGRFPASAPGLIGSHTNPKRARTKLIREVTTETYRTHALRAVARPPPGPRAGWASQGTRAFFRDVMSVPMSAGQSLGKGLGRDGYGSEPRLAIVAGAWSLDASPSTPRGQQ